MPKEPANKPPCASWRLWRGKEIEGKNGVGEQTLFVRDLQMTEEQIATYDFSLMTGRKEITRVWFCKEFQQWEIIRKMLPHFKTCCIEVTERQYFNIPPAIMRRCVVYLKVGIRLKAGDHVCVGDAFSDEAFVVGEGVKVSPEDYLNDTKIL